MDNCMTHTCANHNTSHDYLYVVVVISNPVRYKRRYELFNQFCDRMKANPKVQLYSAELQQGSRPFATDSMFKYRTIHELWHKENLINKVVEHLPVGWKYMAWIDADVEFERDDWAEETLDQLQHYSIVQLFSHAIDMGPNKETIKVHCGFGYRYINGEEWNDPTYGKFFHPGYAWACTKRAFDQMGGLIDFAPLGSADHHMALAWIGLVDKSLNHNLSSNYKLMCRIFQDRCDEHIKRNLGYVNGTITHHWHGDKKFRQYKERWQILIENKYDPLTDIKRDSQGLWQLETKKIQFRDDLRAYFRNRNEDSIDIIDVYK